MIYYLCIIFLSAACMTWELAESGKHFITTIVNGSDLVPTFSAASVDDLRSEVLLIIIFSGRYLNIPLSCFTSITFGSLL